MIDPIAKLKALFPWPSEPPKVPPNLTGWFKSSKRPLLERAVPSDAKVILELGSWHGQSTCWFLSRFPEAAVIAVDTWFGSVEHVLKRKYRRMLPTLHETFLVNCWEFRDRLVPIRNTSLAAMQILKQLGVVPDAIYFDADHSYWGLMSELETAQSFFPEAVFVGDDYSGVVRALLDFADYEPGRGGSMWRGWIVDQEGESWHLRREE